MKRILFAFALPLGALTSTASMADTRFATVGPWQVDAVENAGRVTACRATRREGELLFSFTRAESGPGVLLSTEKWKLDRGTAYRVTLAAPPAPPFSGQARASAGNELDLSVTPEFLRSLDGKAELEVRPVATSYRLSLARAPEALKAMEDCWTARTAKVAPPALPGPALSSAALSPSAPTLPQPDKLTAVSDVLSPTAVEALSRNVLGPDARVQPTPGGGFNMTQGVTVTIAQAAAAAGDLNSVIVIVGETVAAGCQGPASPEITKLDTAGLVKSARLEIGCDTARGAARFDTTIISDGLRLQTFTSVGRDRDTVGRIGARFYDELRKLYR